MVVAFVGSLRDPLSAHDTTGNDCDVSDNIALVATVLIVLDEKIKNQYKMDMAIFKSNSTS